VSALAKSDSMRDQDILVARAIAVSEGYNSKDACVNGIESVKKNAPIAKIVEAKNS
jgi:hypothetical protein